MNRVCFNVGVHVFIQNGLNDNYITNLVCTYVSQSVAVVYNVKSHVIYQNEVITNKRTRSH